MATGRKVFGKMVARDRIELSTRGFSVYSVCLSMSFNVTKFTAQCDKIVPRIHIEILNNLTVRGGLRRSPWARVAQTQLFAMWLTIDSNANGISSANESTVLDNHFCPSVSKLLPNGGLSFMNRRDNYAGPLFATDSEEKDRSRAYGRPIR